MAEFRECRRASRLLQLTRKTLFSFYGLALTRMSFRDFPLRYDRRGGSLKIFLSCGWFSIKSHFPLSGFPLSYIGKAGWYCVKKGRIFFRAVLSLFVNNVSLSENLTSERCFTTIAASTLKACCKSSNVFLKSSLCGICLWKPESFRDAWWVTRIKIRVLKGLCRFKICSSSIDSLGNLPPLYTIVSKKIVSRFLIFQP